MNAKLLQLIIQLKDEASAALGKLQGTLSSVGGFLSGAFTAAVVGAGIAIAGLAAGSLTAAADFETATANFASVAGGSLAEAGFALDDVKSKALELGAVTQFSAGQAQDAMIALAKGGVPVVDIMGDATAAALDLAAAGSLELGPAADIVAKQLGVWANTGVNAAQVANLMAQAANASTIDVDELALGLANVGGVAKVSGVSFQDLNQTMALIAPGFASAADAGTSLKTFLLSLGGSSTSAIDAMKSLGLVSIDYAAIADDLGIAFDGTQKSAAALDEAILRTIDAQAGANRSTKEWKDAYAAFLQDFTTNAFYDQAGQMKDMGAVAQILQDSLAGLSEEEKTAALNAIFGSDAYRAAAFIAEAGASGFDAMGQAMTAAGTAAEQAAVKNKTFAFAWDSLKGSIETVRLIIGSAPLPLLTDLTNTVLIPAVNGVMALASALTTSNDPWATFVGMLNSALPGLGSFVDFVATNVLPILSAIGAMILAAIVPAFWAWAAAAIPAAAATIAATLPLIAIISAIGLAVGLLVAAWQNNWFGIRDAVAGAWAYLQPVFQQVWAWLTTNIPIAITAAVATFWTIVAVVQAVASAIQTGFGMAVAWLSGAWLSISTSAAAAWGAIVGWVVGAATAIQATWAATVAWFSGIWISVSTTALAAWTAITTAVSSAIAIVGTIIQTGMSIVTTIALAAWNTLVFLTGLALQGLLAVVMPPIQAIAAVIGPPIMLAVQAVVLAWQWLASVASGIWASIQAAVGAAAAGISAGLAAVGGAINGAVAVVSAGAAGLVSTLAAAGAQISGVLTTAWSTVQAGAASAWAAITSAISSGVAAITSVVASGWATVQSSTSGVWASIQSAVTTAIAAVKTVIETGVNLAKTVVLAAWAVIVAASQNNFSAIPTIISTAWGRIKSLFADGVAGVRDALLGLAADAGNIASAIVSGLVRGISNGIGSVINAAKNLAQSAYKAAMGALDAHSPSRLFEGVGDTVPAGMALGIDAGMPKVGASLSDGIADITKDARSKAGNAGKHITAGLAAGMTAGLPAVNQNLIDGIAGLSESAAKAIESGSQAIAAANAYGGGGGSGLSAFLGDFARLAVQFNYAAVALGGQILGTATRFADTIGKISEPVSKAVTALQGLNDLVTPSVSAISAFTATLAVLLSMLTATATSMDVRGLAAAVQFADASGKILAVVKTGVDAFAALNTYVQPVPGQVTAFTGKLAWLIQQFVQAGAWLQGAGLAAGVVLAAAADKILAVVKTGVESFAALNTYVQPVPGQVTAFTGKLAWLIQQFVQAGAWLQGAGLAAGVVLAAAADKILAVVKTGVESFAALNTYVQPVPGQVTAFTGKLNWLIQQFVDAGAWLRGPGLAAGVALADAAGKILGIIGSGVDAFAKLAIFAPIPQWAITAFGQALQATLVVLIAIATTWAQAAIDRAAVFADGAGKSIAIIGSGVEGFTKLATFQGVPQAAIDAFGQALNAALTVIEYISATWIQAAIDRAAVFADGAGKSIAIIGSGVEGFTKLATFQGVPQAAIDAFGQALNAALTVIEYISATWIQAAIDRAAVFAEGAGKTIAIIGGGVDGFIKLASFQGVPEAAFTALGQALNQALVVIDDLSATWASTGLERAVAWAQAVDTIAKTITGAIDTISKLGQLQNGAAGLLDTFAATLTGMLAEMQRIAVPATQTLGQQMSWGIAQGIEAGTPAIVQAVYAAMNAALAAARAALGIASPSTVFDEDIGQMGGAGMARGFDRSAPMVAAAASRMAGAAVVPAQAALRPVAAPVGGGGAAAPAPAAASQISVIFQSGAIVQQPGESGEALANRVVTLLEERIRLRGL